MKLRAIALIAAVLTLSVGAVAIAKKKSNGKPGNGTLFATLLGKKEVSPTTGKKGAGDKDGRAGFTAVIDGTDFCWGYAAKNVDGTPSGAHIHKGRPSVNGPVVIPLDTPSSADPGSASGCETISEELAKAINKNPRKYYFNLHTTPDFASGAVRGQLGGKR